MIEIIRIVLFVCILVIIAVIDQKKGIIPNKIVYPAAAAAVVLNLLSPDISAGMSLIGGVVLAVFFMICFIVLKQLGMGDIKLGLLIGLMTGFPEAFIALISGVFLGGLAALVLVAIRKKGRKDDMPYGPYLAAGAILTVIGIQFSMFDFLYSL